MLLSSAASILLFAWQPFPGEYRIGIFALMILGIYRLLQKQIDLNRLRAPRIIGTLQIFGGHKNAAKEAAAQENIISTIDELP
jgi:hypothetical protein